MQKINILGEPEKEIKRALGMIILRGENIVSITAEAPPNVQVSYSRNFFLNLLFQTKRADQGANLGKAQPIDRPGVQLNPTQAPTGLGGISKGVGQINPQSMMPMTGSFKKNFSSLIILTRSPHATNANWNPWRKTYW